MICFITVARRQLLSVACVCLLAAPSLHAEITLIGSASIPGTAIDLSGMTDVLSDGTPHNRLGSMGSGIAYTGKGDRYLLVADRGPADGTVPYRCRMQTMDILVTPGATAAVRPVLAATTLLKNEKGESFVGISSAFDLAHPEASLRLDPEGIRLSRTGTVFISDEYGPYVYEFTREGRRIRSLKVPERFLIKKPHADHKEEVAANMSGRVTNHGLEGLAISPDGSKLFGIMQNPLIQEGGKEGTNARILEIDIKSGANREFLYLMENPKRGMNEILAINDHDFLVIERDSKAGTDAKAKKIYRIDIIGASDISSIDRLPKTGLPTGIKPVKKALFINMLDPKFGLANEQFPAKIEGLAFGPDLPDGRHTLVVTSDNDLIATQPNWFYVFAFEGKDLPGLQKQIMEP